MRQELASIMIVAQNSQKNRLIERSRVPDRREHLLHALDYKTEIAATVQPTVPVYEAMRLIIQVEHDTRIVLKESRYRCPISRRVVSVCHRAATVANRS
jgi:hypothetical protein